MCAILRETEKHVVQEEDIGFEISTLLKTSKKTILKEWLKEATFKGTEEVPS